MFYQFSICLLPAVLASASFRTVTTGAPIQSPFAADALPQDTYLARRQNSDNGGCGVASVDCQNGFCCEAADTCAMRNGQTVCLPAGIDFADPVPAFTASEGVSSVVPTSSPAVDGTSSTAVDQTSSSPAEQTSSAPAAASESQSDGGLAAAETTSSPSASQPTGEDSSSAAGSRPNGNSSGNSSLSGGAIAGIVVGVVVGVLLIVGAIGFMVFRARKRDRINYDEPAAPSAAAAAAPAPERKAEPTGPAELETVERVEMEGTIPGEKNLDFGPRSPQEVPGSVPGDEKTT